MAITKRDYVPGKFEVITMTVAGGVTANNYQYFKLDGFLLFELADIIVEIGGEVVSESDYELLQDEKYTSLETTKSGKSLKSMIKFTNAALNGLEFSVSGNNFGTMLSNEALKAYIDDVAGVKYPYSATKDPSGFSCTNIDIIYNSTTRTITLNKGAATELALYYKAVLVPEIVEGWESTPHPDTNANYFFYYNGTAFVWTTAIWDFWQAMIAYVRYKGVSGDTFGIKESHGMGMSYATHEELHNQIGTYVVSGGTFSAFELLSTIAIERRPLVSVTTIADEDNHTILPQLLGTAGSYTWISLENAAESVFTIDNADFISVDGSGKPFYNQNVADVWQQTVMTLNHFQKILIFATPVTGDTSSQKYRYVWWQGQTTSTNLEIIQSLAPSDFEFGDLINNLTEVALIGEAIVKATNNNWFIQELNILRGTKATLVSSSATGTTPALQQVTDVGATTTKDIILDITGKSITDRPIGAYDSITDQFLWSVDGEGTMRAVAAVVGSEVTAVEQNFTLFLAHQISRFGEAVSNGATATFAKPHDEEGYHFYSTKLNPGSAVALFYTDQGDASDGVDAFRNDDVTTYYAYRGERTNGDKYWFVDTVIRDGEDAFTLAIYRSAVPVAVDSITPTDSVAYTGVTEAGEQGAFAFEDGLGIVGIETDSIIITDSPAKQEALPNGTGGLNYAGYQALIEDNFTGSYANGDAETVTVVDGLITDVS